MNLQDVVSKICDYHEMHNNNLFFERVRDCIDSCLSLLNPYFEIDELVAIEKSKKARMHEDSEQLNGIYHEISIKRLHFDPVKQKRDYARIETLLFYLSSYNKWPDDERPNTLEYFVFNVVNAGVSEDAIYSIITKKFKDILSHIELK